MTTESSGSVSIGLGLGLGLGLPLVLLAVGLWWYLGRKKGREKELTDRSSVTLEGAVEGAVAAPEETEPMVEEKQPVATPPRTAESLRAAPEDVSVEVLADDEEKAENQTPSSAYGSPDALSPEGSQRRRRRRKKKPEEAPDDSTMVSSSLV